MNHGPTYAPLLTAIVTTVVTGVLVWLSTAAQAGITKTGVDLVTTS